MFLKVVVQNQSKLSFKTYASPVLLLKNTAIYRTNVYGKEILLVLDI